MADVECGVQVRHFPVSGTEAPGTFVIDLVADAPQTVDAEWEAYTDRGFLRAVLPTLNLDASPRTPIMLAAHSRAIVIRIPPETHVYVSWLRTVDSLACAPPQGFVVHPLPNAPQVRETIPMPNPADAPVDAIEAPGLERMDCAHPFAEARPDASVAPLYPWGVFGSGVSLIKILIAPDGRVADASIFRSAGNIRFDEAALAAAAHSTFIAPVAFCRPTFGTFIVREDFGPS